jgi:hypothetical protein
MLSSSPDQGRPQGPSLTRGPALILGTILLLAGLYFLYKLHTFPRLSQFPNGTARVGGTALYGIFAANGWSAELTAAAGGALLFGAAQHLLAKVVSFIVGVVLAVVAVIALVHHHSALGLFAANIPMIILWAAAAVILLINALLPRLEGRERSLAEPRREAVVSTRRGAVAPSVAARPRSSEAGSIHVPTSEASVQQESATVEGDRPVVRIRPNSSTPALVTGGSDDRPEPR